jgi:MFS family permease
MEKPPLPAIMHLESVTAAEVAKDVQAVDANEAKVIHQTLDSSQQGGYTPITAEEKAQHRNLNRKLDLFLVPFCALIYVFNGLDRSNLGNAQIDEFTNDLGMPTSAINTATSLFFATYVPLQPFSASIGKKVGQTYWLGIIGVGWGVLTLGHAFIKTESQLIAIRLLIGVLESGFYPTVVSYMSRFYPRYDLAFRIALFYGSYAIAGAFGGIIAYGCFKIDGSLHGWQYLFIIEGTCSIGIALLTPFWLAKSPGTAWFLTENERSYAENRMVIDTTANLDSTTKLNRCDIIEGCKDWKLWFILPFNILTSIPPQGFTIFFPLVVKVNAPSVPFLLLMHFKCHELLPTRGEVLRNSDSEGLLPLLTLALGSRILRAHRKSYDGASLCYRRHPSPLLRLVIRPLPQPSLPHPRSPKYRHDGTHHDHHTPTRKHGRPLRGFSDPARRHLHHVPSNGSLACRQYS